MRTDETGADRTRVACRVAMVLLGCAGLVLKPRFAGPVGDVVWSYWGNVTVSFAVFFIAGLVAPVRRHGRLAVAAVALLVVGLFEATDGFAVMTNVYDPGDFIADAAGVGLALLADAACRAPRDAR